MAERFIPEIGEVVVLPEDMPNMEVERRLAEARYSNYMAPGGGGDVRTGMASFLSAIPQQVAQFAAEMNTPASTLPDVSGKDVLGLTPQQTNATLNAIQRDNEVQMQDRRRQQEHVRRGIAAEKVRGQALQFAQMKEKNDKIETDMDRAHKERMAYIDANLDVLKSHATGATAENIAQTAASEQLADYRGEQILTEQEMRPGRVASEQAKQGAQGMLQRLREAQLSGEEITNERLQLELDALPPLDVMRLQNYIKLWQEQAKLRTEKAEATQKEQGVLTQPESAARERKAVAEADEAVAAAKLKEGEEARQMTPLQGKIANFLDIAQARATLGETEARRRKALADIEGTPEGDALEIESVATSMVNQIEDSVALKFTELIETGPGRSENIIPPDRVDAYNKAVAGQVVKLVLDGKVAPIYLATRPGIQTRPGPNGETIIDLAQFGMEDQEIPGHPPGLIVIGKP